MGVKINSTLDRQNKIPDEFKDLANPYELFKKTKLLDFDN